MGNYDSVPLKPEEVQNLRQTFTAERLETMLEQASSLYGDEAEVGDPDQKVLEEVEAIKVKHEQEIFDLKTEMKKKDEMITELLAARKSKTDHKQQFQMSAGGEVVELVSAADLKAGGYSARKLRAAGVSAKEMRRARFPLSTLMARRSASVMLDLSL